MAFLSQPGTLTCRCKECILPPSFTQTLNNDYPMQKLNHYVPNSPQIENSCDIRNISPGFFV